jgi:hypothetical protein
MDFVNMPLICALLVDGARILNWPAFPIHDLSQESFFTGRKSLFGAFCTVFSGVFREKLM